MLAAVASMLLAAGAPGATVALPASRDNTLFQFSPADISNGAGQHFFAGTNANGNVRRGVIAFDVSSIPAGSTIQSVRLRLFMSRTTTGAFDVSLHRCLADWGEGFSDAEFDEGGGTVAEPGDATWEHRFYPDVFWSTFGGDFAPAPTTTASIAGVGFYEFTGGTLVTEVQAWLDAPASNFGWVMIGDEAGNRTAKRFDSRENPIAENQPQLIVEFLPPACPGDADGDNMVGLSDIAAIVTAWGMTVPPGTGPDLDGSGDVGLGDIAVVVQNWGTVCP